MSSNKILLALAVALAGIAPAHAQTAPALATVVATCGTPPSTYTAGQNRPTTQNTSGQACALSTLSPAGTQDVNIVQTGGVTQLRGAGAVGTGSERVAVGQDTTTIAGSAPGTAQAPSTNVVSTTVPVTNYVTGTASQTSTTTTSLVGAVASNKLYITGYACSNSGSSASLVSFQDGSGGSTLWTALVPSGGGNNLSSQRPLFNTASGNALYFAPGTASTTVYCSASGFSGS